MALVKKDLRQAPNMNINVVHVKNFGTKSKQLQPGEMYIYCGRPSRLGNPFVMKNEKDREDVIRQFGDKLPLADIQDLHRYCLSKNVHTLHLGCYCAPKACHCDVIKKELILMMQNSVLVEYAKTLKEKLESNGIKFKIGFDEDDSLIVVCEVGKENETLKIVENLKMPQNRTVFVGSSKEVLHLSDLGVTA